MPQSQNTVATALAQLQQEIQGAVNKAPTPMLIAVSKGQPAPQIAQAIGLGVSHFGENRVQEAISKWPELKKAHPGVTLHLIGSLQSNKVAEAVALFDVIQTVDREKIADAIAAEMAKQHRALDVLIQVNTGEEPQKGGVSPRDLEKLVIYCREQAKLNLTGLMCVPPADENPAPHFALMQKLAREFDLPELSMGMSGDFTTAIRVGATFVRIGTRLFGPRP
jgi:pyridoxal phosphate enzyme (YggS family)